MHPLFLMTRFFLFIWGLTLLTSCQSRYNHWTENDDSQKQYYQSAPLHQPHATYYSSNPNS